MSQTVVQLGLWTSVVRAPRRVRTPSRNAGICSSCGGFSLDVRKETQRGRRITGVVKERPRSRLLCAQCRKDPDREWTVEPKHKLSPTAAVQLLVECPLQHSYGVAYPGQPASREHALGVAYHKARQRLFARAPKTEQSFRFTNPQANISALTRGTFRDPELFPHGVLFRDEWEEALLEDALRRMLEWLWQHKQIVSAKRLAELYAEQGKELVWASAELPIRKRSVYWLLGGVAEPSDDGISFTGVPDVVLVYRENGEYTVKIIDHKIPGADLFPELRGSDVQLQLGMYGLWATRAFRSVGVTAERVVLEVHEMRLAPLGLKKWRVAFNEEMRQATVARLREALRALEQFRVSGFPARPESRLCGSCDFGTGGGRRCTSSRANSGAWGLEIAREPLPFQRRTTAPQRTQQSF